MQILRPGWSCEWLASFLSLTMFIASFLAFIFRTFALPFWWSVVMREDVISGGELECHRKVWILFLVSLHIYVAYLGLQ